MLTLKCWALYESLLLHFGVGNDGDAVTEHSGCSPVKFTVSQSWHSAAFVWPCLSEHVHTGRRGVPDRNARL